jgi:hypothetical protein
MNSYDLSRNYWNWAFDNPEKVKPIHSAIYFFAIEHCNRLGWKEKFGFPSQMTMDAIGVKKWHTYSNAFNDLIEWGFIKLVQKSKNQYSSNIISLVYAMPKKGEALDKAMAKHGTKHGTKQGQYNKTINNKHLTIEERKNDFWKNLSSSFIDQYEVNLLKDFFDYWTEASPGARKMRFEKEKAFDVSRRLKTWLKNESKFGNKMDQDNKASDAVNWFNS